MKILALLAVLVLGAVAESKAATLPPLPANYKVILTWQAPVNSQDPVNDYNIYSQVNRTGNFSLTGTVPASTLTYIDMQVLFGNSYTYYVKSQDSSGNESVASNSWTGVIPFIPFPPTVGVALVK